MTDTKKQPFFSRPLVRIGLCCCAGFVILVGGIGVANYAMRKDSGTVANVGEADLNDFVSRATDLCREEQYQEALGLLKPVSPQLFAQSHVAGLKIYAESRAAVPRDRNAHITMAAATYVRIAELDRQDFDVRVRLFELFREVHDNDAACQYGNEAVELTPDNHRLRVDVGDVHLKAARPEVALKHAEFVLAADPQDIAAASLMVRSLVATGVASPEILSSIEELYAGRTTEQDRVDRTLLMLALANETQDWDSAKLLTSLLTPEDIPESAGGDRSDLLASAFASAGRSLDALRVAERTVGDPALATTKAGQTRFISLLYRYLWAGEHQRLLAATEELPGADSEDHAEVVLIRFLSLWLQDQRDELPGLAQKLSLHKSHRTRCWTPVLTALSAATPKEQEVLAATAEALSQYPQSPILRFINAQALRSLGDYDAAIAEYRLAVSDSPRWGQPRIALAGLLMDRGSVSLAFREALEAVKAVPHSSEAFQALTMCAAKSHTSHRLDDRTRQAIADTVQHARDTSKTIHSRRILDAAFHFLEDDPAATAATIDELLRNPEGLSDGDFELLLTIAATDSLREEVIGCRQAQSGLTLSEVLKESIQTAREQGAEAAKRYLDNAVTQGQLLPKRTRDLLFAETLSATGSPDAMSAWITLSEDYQTDLRVQQRAARARELANDFPVRQRIVASMKAVSPPDAVLWQVEAARLLLDQDTSQEAAAQAALAMSDLLKTAPSSADAHVLAVRAFQRLEKSDRVLTICRDAIARGLNNPELLLRTAELAPTREEAVSAARSALARSQKNSQHRQRAIVVLLRHGDYKFAADGLARDLPEIIVDSDDHFTRFSTLAIALANDGSVTQVLRPIESLAPTSDRWFHLWLDIAQVSSVAPEDAATMLEQAGEWLSEEQPERKRRLAAAWRNLARRSPDPKCLDHAFETLNAIIGPASTPEEQMGLASLALKAGRQDAAIAIYQNVTAGHSENAFVCAAALNNLAMLKLTDPAELESANELASRAWALLEKPQFVDTLVEIHLRLNRKEDALKLLQDGMQKWPENSQLKRLAARIKPEPMQQNEG